jgi:hypothetical protein
MTITRLRRISSTLAAFAIVMPSIASADSLSELWARPVRGNHESIKTALALEYCIGTAVSDWGYAHVLHGEGVTEIYAGLPYAIRVVDNGPNRRVSFTATAAYNDRLSRAIRGCL